MTTFGQCKPTSFPLSEISKYRGDATKSVSLFLDETLPREYQISSQDYLKVIQIL